MAEYLRADPRVASVSYAGFPDNPYYPLAQKYLGGRACSLMTFAIRGGFDGGARFYDALKLFKRLVNLGDAKSLACHPASTTHRQMSVEEQRVAGDRTGDDPPEHRHRAHRRHHRGSGPGARRRHARHMSAGKELPAPPPALFPDRATRTRVEDALTRALLDAGERVAQGSVVPTLERAALRQELAQFDFVTPTRARRHFSSGPSRAWKRAWCT